jgi:hypothetical protein
MPAIKTKYIEREAAHSGSESEGHSDGSDDSYEKDSFVVSDHESASDEEASQATTGPAPAKKSKSATVEKAVKVFSNKTVAKAPPKPSGPKATKQAKRPYLFQMIFTNGILLRKFLEPAAHAVKKMRFEVCASQAFTGFKIECHDQAFSLADLGTFQCDVEGHKAHGQTFCVNAEAFMEALMSSTLKETDLRITRYEDRSDSITFECINNDNDVRTVYHCELSDGSQMDLMHGLKIELGFHSTVHLGTLKELSLNAKRCGAPTLQFKLWQAVDAEDSNVVHSKLCIGFKGPNTSGSHDFFITMRRSKAKAADGTMEVLWEPMAPKALEDTDDLDMELKCDNAYDNKKLRLFLNHMECSWTMIHLCTDNTPQPLVMDFELGGQTTKHTVIVGPREPDETA